ncbi:MAG: UDP-N-acetylmuramate:L-alanyl-gamma-D-glutamyl-meso-diaminopimelate ligase [Vicinamibacterales bacterium]
MARRVHFIGICGTAMGTLAAMLQRRGDLVQGSDAHVYPPMSDFLRAEGITLLDGYDADHVQGAIDVVVVGNAISRGNPELEAVLDRSIRYVSLPEMIRETFLWDADAVVIAGTHGKTTTTALTGWVLTAGGADPSVLVGGIARNLGDGQGGSYRLGRGRAFVIEGDEYDSAYFDKTAKFLKYLPDIAVVNNIEFDHADIYEDLDAVRLAFQRLVRLVPRRGLVLLGADSAEAAALAPLAHARVQTFGTAPGLTWRATEVDIDGAGTRFTVEGPDGLRADMRVPLLGLHNVRNALAAIAVAHDHGLGVDAIREGLASFAGVKRRLEVVGERRGIRVYDDFAHHPTAVAETIAALRAGRPGRRVWAIFEPRSASSCRRVFQDDFARAFGGADQVIVAPVFRSTLPEDQRLSVPQLVADLTTAGVAAREIPSIEAIVATIATEAREGDDVLVMSNGGFGGIHGKLLEALA